MTIADPAAHPGASQQAVVDAALLLPERMGLSPSDLVAVPRDRPVLPTFAEYIPVVSAAVTTGTRRAYGSYWNRVLEQWGDRRLDEPSPSEIRHLMAYVKTHVVARRNARGGRSAAEHLVAALRCLYRHAEDDGLITEADNPARKVDKPRRLPSTRRAVADTRLAEINQVAATTGNDPELDTTLLRLHTETACRRGGALAPRAADLDPDQCLILLREKGETVRWQPVSPTLMARLVQHGQERHAPPDGQLLRYLSGQPISSRRDDHLWVRIGKQLPWVRTQQISTHWLRHGHQTCFGFATA
jgi:site-specific recombinase XerD